MLSTMRGDEPLLPQLEAVWAEVLKAFGDGDSEPGRQLLRVRRLMRTEPTLRMSAASLDEERQNDLVARLTRLTGEPDGIRARVLTEAAVVSVRIALDTWADSVEAGRPVYLLATYARCRAQMRQALGEPAPL